MDLYAKRTFSIDTENAFKIGPSISQLDAENQDRKVIKLNLGEPDFELQSFIKKEIKRQLDHNNTHYCDPKGILSLRKAIAQQIYKTRGLSISPEQVVVFPGAKPAIGFSQQVYCDPGDEIIYPSPGYPIFESFIKYLGCIPVPAHLNEKNNFTLSAEQLSECLSPKTKLIYLNFPSNPTGGVATQKQIEALAEVILKKCHPNVRIYSDEIYERIIFDKLSHYSIASVPGMEKRTIISSGFSKTFGWTGGRVGYAIFPTIEEADVFKNLNINYFSCVPPYNQEAARLALVDPRSETFILNMVHILEQRRNAVLKALTEIDGLHCTKPHGTFFVFPNIAKACQDLGVLQAYKNLAPSIQEKTSPSTLFQLFALYKHRIAVMDRRSFGKIGSENEHFIRLSFAADIPILQEGVSRLKNAFQDKEGFKEFIQDGKHFF